MSVCVTLDGREHQLGFTTSGEEPGREEDFLLPLTLFPAMLARSRLKLPGKLSPRLLSAVPKIQDVFRLWGDEYWGEVFQGLGRVPLEAEPRTETTERASGVACFFSGGVDSFYTLLKNQEEVTHLIFVHGFDIALENEAVRSQASVMAGEVAKALGKTFVEVEANISPFPRTLLGWEKYHGAAMASVALLFQHLFRKALIAASYTYAELTPWGSHAVLDPLWSTELTEIVHDGCEATRIDKLAYIAEHDLAMRWLRVCNRARDSAYNCGRCGKCLRARVVLQAVGALERCETLPHDLSLEEVANMPMPNEAGRFVVMQTLKALERRGTQPELRRTIAEVLDKSPQTNEAMAERAERIHRERELSVAQKKLEQTHARLEASRGTTQRLHTKVQRLQARAQRLETRAERLEEHNRLLNARLSGRRYRLADALATIASRTPMLGKLVQRQDTAENRQPPN